MAIIDITPSNKPPLAGFGGSPRRDLMRHLYLNSVALFGKQCIDPDPRTPEVLFKPSKGVLDPIYARALVLTNGARKIAFVKLDTIGVSRKLRDTIAAAARPLDIEPQDLVVLGTHTHSGPGSLSDQPLWEVAGTDCFNQGVYDTVAAGAIEALGLANAGLQRARLGVGTSRVRYASKIRNQLPTELDDELVVVKIVTPSGEPIAALFNFAVHGTALGSDNMLMSADCMGAMETEVERLVGGGVTAIFTNGAEGDVKPAYNKVEGMRLVGTLVGYEVAILWPAIPTKRSVTLNTALLDVAMPAPRLNLFGKAFVPIFFDPDWVSTTLPFQAVQIDDAVLVGIPGEPVTDVGRQIKQRAIARGFPHPIVLGLANDHGGYFTTMEQYEIPTYEGRSNIYSKGSGQLVVEKADAVMGLLP